MRKDLVIVSPNQLEDRKWYLIDENSGETRRISKKYLGRDGSRYSFEDNRGWGLSYSKHDMITGQVKIFRHPRETYELRISHKSTYHYGFEDSVRRTNSLDDVAEDLYGDDLPSRFKLMGTKEKEQTLIKAVKGINEEGNYNQYIFRKEGRDGFAEPY